MPGRYRSQLATSQGPFTYREYSGAGTAPRCETVGVLKQPRSRTTGRDVGVLMAVLLCATMVPVAPTASAASVRVARCRTSYGISQPTMSLPQLVGTSLPASQAARLAFYGNNELLVLAPAAWSCSGQIGADGSAGMLIIHGQEAVGVHAVPYTSGVGASEACALFADARPPVRCLAHPPRQELVSHLSRTAVAFEDPPGIHGTGDPSGGHLPANGVMLYNPSPSVGFFYQETCVLPASQHNTCTVLLNDALARAPR